MNRAISPRRRLEIERRDPHGAGRESSSREQTAPSQNLIANAHAIPIPIEGMPYAFVLGTSA